MVIQQPLAQPVSWGLGLDEVIARLRRHRRSRRWLLWARGLGKVHRERLTLICSVGCRVQRRDYG